MRKSARMQLLLAGIGLAVVVTLLVSWWPSRRPRVEPPVARPLSRNDNVGSPSSRSQPAGPSYEAQLYAAMTHEQWDVAKRLIEGGADIKSNLQDGRTVLHYAANAGRVDLIQLLLARGADVNARTDSGATPLHDAARSGRNAAVKALLAHGAMVDAIATENGTHTPLTMAVQAGWTDTADLLLKGGANVNLAGPDGWRPLFTAVERGLRSDSRDRPRLAKFLLDHGADVNAIDKCGRTAMSAELLDLLVSHGANLNPLCAWPPLRRSVWDGWDKPEYIERLIAKGAKVDILAAAGLGRIDRVRELLDADPSLVKTQLQDIGLGPLTPLDFAREHRHEEVVRSLVEHGAVADIKTAAWLGMTDRVALLLKSSPALLAKETDDAPMDWAIRDAHESLAEAMNLAVEADRKAVVDLLLARGFDLAENPESMTLAAQYHHIDIARSLLRSADKAADKQAMLSHLTYPLHAVALNGDIEMARLFLAHGADAGAIAWITEGDEQDAIQTALGAKHKDLLRLLMSADGPVFSGDYVSRLRLCEYDPDVSSMVLELFLERWKTDDDAKHRTKEQAQDALGDALVVAAKADLAGWVKVLIALGANPKAVQWNGVGGRAVSVLLAHGVDANSIFAADGPEAQELQTVDAPAAEALLSAGADPNARFEDGSTLLSEAKLPVAKVLLAHGANPNPPHVKFRMTPLQHAIYMAFYYGGDMELANLLLTKGAKVDFESACALGMAEVVEADLKADPDLVRKSETTNAIGPPVGLAVQGGHAEVVKLLLAHGAKPTGLEIAVERSRKDLVAMLLDAGDDLAPVERNCCMMPLEFASDATRGEIARMIQSARAKRDQSCRPSSMAAK